MRRAKIRPARGATVTDAILAHYRTRRGYDLQRFAADLRSLAPIAERRKTSARMLTASRRLLRIRSGADGAEMSERGNVYEGWSASRGLH